MSPVARSMQRVRLPLRYRFARALGVALLGFVGVIVLPIAAGVIAHVLWGWALVGWDFAA